jgi:hypothetical protein
MSTLTVQTISNGVVSTSSENVIRGSARAWVNFNLGTVTASYNVSSVTYSSTGIYVINFTNAFANTNYCAVMGGNMRNSGGETIVNQNFNVTKTTSSMPIRSMTGSGTAADASPLYVACYI